MIDTLQIYLCVSAILFNFGIFAVITRKNAVAILMGIELILNAANINFIAFNRFGDFKVLDGHIFSIFVNFAYGKFQQRQAHKRISTCN